MIVNAHVHLIELAAMVRRYPNLSLAQGIAVYTDIEAALPMVLPETAIAQMDEAGISQSILYAVEAPLVYASNQYVHNLCERFPRRFIGFASVDPRDPEAPAALEAAVQDMGMQGLKLHPPLQDFFPNDEAVFPVYEKALELDIPVVFHIGSTPFGAACRLAPANPLYLDDVAVRFPELRILLTHLGTLWHNEAFMVAEKNPNVFIDTSAYLSEIPKVLTPDLIQRVGADRFIFGTDYPTPYAGRLHRMKDFVDCIKGLRFPEDVLDGIMSENVQMLLHGRPQTAPPLDAAALLAKLQGFLPGDRAQPTGEDQARG